jgi:hypothetical protein
MILFYISIPFMLVGVALALAPLLWALRSERSAVPVVVQPSMVQVARYRVEEAERRTA